MNLFQGLEPSARSRVNPVRFFLISVAACSVAAAADPPATFKQYCFGCHGKSAAMGGVSLEKLLAAPTVGENFQHWEKVAAMLDTKRMPPPKVRQPDDESRRQAADWVRAQLKAYAAKHDGDPGRVTVRRLTGGEYSYTIGDLTGLSLSFDHDLAGDSVGGEGFTSFGDVQFMQDANLERYLDAAKRVASHAVVGAGPLQFFGDAGKSGFELSAIARIQNIYTTHGFRAAAAEGARPYGLERYGKAFYAAWRFRHRAALGEPQATLASIAKSEGLSARFVEHIWKVVSQTGAQYPVSEIVSKFDALPGPGSETKAVRTACEGLQRFVIDWPRYLFAAGELAAGGQGDERALILTETSLKGEVRHQYRFNLRNGASATSKVYLTAVTVNGAAKDAPAVLWSNATVRMRGKDRAFGPPQPLRSVVKDKIAYDANGNFTTQPGQMLEIEIPAVENAGGAEFTVEASIPEGTDAVLRCTVSDKPEVSRGRPMWALLADGKSEGYKAWLKGTLAFARDLPQNSQGEATPADRDDIPAPFNNTYNQPERDRFHTKLKYYRTDRFLVEKMLDDATRVRLEQAWSDLLSSFDYHDEFLHFVAEKFKLDLKKKSIGQLTAAEIAALPEEPRQYVAALKSEYNAVRKLQRAAEPGHVEDALRFASEAWRRPLTVDEKTRLRAFYATSRKANGLTHDAAIRATIARVLVAPAFLYRIEPARLAGTRPLTSWEMASRLSYFLWSSAPDAELRRAAAANELVSPQHIAGQVKRMLADPKARRFSTEFFGQWLGFYRFDQFTGVDTSKFPEFTDEVKSAMYDEAVSFFEHVVRKERPVREMFFADYTFLNQTLAKHYGVNKAVSAQTERVDGANAFQRGGLLRLGAVLTATSAPLRTSPVKRGDWVLRRILGTPTPPPPADAGSIPADEKAFGGLSLRERLMAHQRNATCAGCHTRIDPLGFPLERYDAVGRWRSTYQDGKPVDDSAELADHTAIAGVGGLLKYLGVQEKQVLRTMSYKLIGYALGRTVLASDQPLVDRMIASGGDATITRLVTDIATSKQFRYRREDKEGGS